MPVPPAPGGLAWTEAFRIEAADGTGLRAALWHGGDRGLVVLLPGRTEFLEKLAIVSGPLVARGFTVASLDWRGQGLSDRLAEPAVMGHVGDFAEYRQDLAALLADPRVRAAGPVRLVLAHSMGGVVAVTAAAEGLLPRTPAVLSAPMWGIPLTPALRLAAWTIIPAARLIRRTERWPPFGNPAVPHLEAATQADNMLTSDAAVFDWMRAAIRAEPRLALAMPSIGWCRAAFAEIARLRRLAPLEAPALCLLGEAERVVDNAAARRLAGRLRADVVEIPGARHEPLIEAQPMRAEAWEAVDAFLARTGV